MKVIVIGANYRRGLYIFRREDDKIGYFELLGTPDIEIEDVLLGNFTDLGGKTVKLMETNESVDIFIEDFCSLEIAKEMIS